MKKTYILSTKYFINEIKDIKITIEGKEEHIQKIIRLLKRDFYVRLVE